jgi:predicted RNA-binding Zn-ribbon protein involved in translation (DUF1610 family)
MDNFMECACIPSAPKARRIRRQRWLIGSLLMAILLAASIVTGQFNLFSYKLYRVFFVALWVGSFFGFVIWMTLSKSTALCPRCGWNIFYRKPMPLTAINVPSVCPNCGLDLEHPYVKGRDQTSSTQSARLS